MLERNWRTRSSTVLVSTVLAATACLSLASPAWSQEVANTLGSRVNGLVSFDFSDKYITPRGLKVEDRGLVVQPLMLLMWKLHTSDKAPLTELTLTTGIWNSFHSQPSGVTPSRWNEIDPIFSLGAKFKGGWALDAGTTAFYTPTDSYATSTHLDLKLTYSSLQAGPVAVNPFVGYWVELNNKATVAFNPATSQEGSYLTIGATPSMPIGTTGMSFEVGASANFVTAGFYQQFDGSDGGSGLAVFTLAPKLTVPLKFLGVTGGAWSAYGGVVYSHLSNDGLLDGNMVLVPGAGRDKNVSRVRGGLTVFF